MWFGSVDVFEGFGCLSFLANPREILRSAYRKLLIA